MNEAWNPISTTAQVEAFRDRTRDLHDGIAKRFHWIGNNELLANGTLAFGAWGALVIDFGIQREPLTTFRVRFIGVSELRFDEHRDGILNIELGVPCRYRSSKRKVVLTALTVEVHCGQVEWLVVESEHP